MLAGMTDLHVRPLRRDADDQVLPADLDAMVELFAAFESARLGYVETTRAEVLAAMAVPRFSREETVLLLDGEGERVVGAVFVMTRPDGKDVYTDNAVRLGAEERRLLEACTHHAVAAARRIAAADGREGWTLRTGCASGDDVSAEVLTSRGLTEVRRFYRMRIPADSPAIPAVRPPLDTSSAVKPESFRDTPAPLAGPAGVEDAVRKGLLRKASAADADAWVDAVLQNSPPRDIPPVAGQGVTKPPKPPMYDTYVVLKPFTYPAGLYGGHSVTFLIPKGVPRPDGNPGHSSVYDFNTLSCQGPGGCGGR